MCVSKHTSVCLKFAKRMLYRYEQSSRALLFHYSNELKKYYKPHYVVNQVLLFHQGDQVLNIIIHSRSETM